MTPTKTKGILLFSTDAILALRRCGQKRTMQEKTIQKVTLDRAKKLAFWLADPHACDVTTFAAKSVEFHVFKFRGFSEFG